MHCRLWKLILPFKIISSLIFDKHKPFNRYHLLIYVILHAILHFEQNRPPQIHPLNNSSIFNYYSKYYKYYNNTIQTVHYTCSGNVLPFLAMQTHRSSHQCTLFFRTRIQLDLSPLFR
ncbi:unnamed protein product [Debaryomyces fabryi]|nr:unnamed protein product [Debaryomyces fabryi]